MHLLIIVFVWWVIDFFLWRYNPLSFYFRELILGYIWLYSYFGWRTFILKLQRMLLISWCFNWSYRLLLYQGFLLPFAFFKLQLLAFDFWNFVFLLLLHINQILIFWETLFFNLSCFRTISFIGQTVFHRWCRFQLWQWLKLNLAIIRPCLIYNHPLHFKIFLL